MKQTAVDWLFKQIYGDTGHIGSYTTEGKDAFEAFKKAKAMEREQRLQDFKEGFQTAVDALQAANNSVQSRKIKGD
jgi:hypothetical protein